MRSRVTLAFLLAMLLPVFGLLSAACTARPQLTGTWISEAPASMHFQFRADGTVWLVTGQASRQIWHYEVDGADLRLYDGIGRKRDVRFAIKQDTLTFYDPATGAVMERYERGGS